MDLILYLGLLVATGAASIYGLLAFADWVEKQQWGRRK